MFYHSTDVDMRMRAARYFGATKKAIAALQQYYQRDVPAIKCMSQADQPNPMFPHPTQYHSLQDGTMHTFRYIGHIEAGKLIFVAKAGNEKICVKFARRYSKEAHMKCASMGFAPQLRGFEELPGGWYMAIMDYLDAASYQELCSALPELSLASKKNTAREIHEAISALHQAGYVHGDIRSNNVMKKKGDGGIMLVDFDWAGIIEEVRYPMNVNIVEIGRPQGAYDGQLILAEHDVAMVDSIFQPCKRTIT
jgi:serine/threonine protein kinase